MANDGIVIKIDGDASDLESTVSKSAEKAASAAKKAAEQASQKAKAGLADVKAGIDMATQALSKLASVAQKGINYNATMESYRTSFEVMTGSAEKATEVVERLRTMGAETPFETTDLVKTTQLLMQYGFTADDAIEKMTMLGDIAQGDREKMNSIALGYAQMSSAGKVNLQDIKQMINGGFNPLQQISESTGESMASLYDRISDGTMSVEEITQAMVVATSEGGKFYQSMEKQSQTMSGQLATLKDNTMELLGSITSGTSSDMQTNMLPMVNNMIAELQSAFDAGGISSLIDEATAMIPDLIGMMTGKLEDALSGISKWAPKLAEALTSSIPSVVSGLSSAVPQITMALFQVASNVVSGLIAMLPELIPALAEGVINMVSSIFSGTGDIINGVFEGIEKAFHQGQEKIAGVWVDSEKSAQIKVGLEAEIDVSDATESVSDAYGEIYAALNKSPLTEDQKQEILALIGNDYDTIEAKLLEFGLSADEAATLATTISENGDKVKEAYAGLDVGIDAGTLAGLTAQCNGSRILLKSKLEKLGLSDEEIQQVLAVYEECSSTISDGTPNIVSQIYDKLTDGEADSEQTVQGLKDSVTGVIDGLISDLDTWYQTEIKKLDPTAADYAARKKALDTQYKDLRAQITSVNSDMTTLVDTYAGAATDVVEAHMEEFAAVEQRLNTIEESIDGLSEKVTSEGEAAFKTVRSGAVTDEVTIGLAINFKQAEYKTAVQEAEDLYNQTITDLNTKLANGEITKDQYNTEFNTANLLKDSALQKAKEQYEQALGEIFAGIAESEGSGAAISKLQDTQVAQQLLAGLFQSMQQGVEVSEEDKKAISDALSKVLGDAFDPETFSQNIDAYNDGGDRTVLNGYLSSIANMISEASTDDLKTAIGGKVGEAYSAALEGGFLTDTSFDTEKDEEQLEAILTAIASTAATTAAPQMQAELNTATSGLTVDMSGAVDSAEEGAEDIVDAADVSTDMKGIGENVGKGFYNGVVPKLRSAVSTAKSIVASLPAEVRKLLNINSPSRVMRRIGESVGEGFDLGVQNSMEEAVRTAKYMTGKLVTASDITQTTRVNMPSLTQEIKLANDQSSTPVNLDGKQIATIQGHNNSMTIAWNNTRYSKGVGGR